MQSFTANDGVALRYLDTGISSGGEGDEGAAREKPLLVLIHGFTGSSRVWQRNISALSVHYRLIVPDLRGHGESDKPKHGFQVSRLAMDLRELILHVESSSGKKRQWKAIGGSLGCSILWCYASLFTTSPFTHTIFVDQSPLQNALPDWDHRFCNRGMNNPSAVASLQTTLSISPETAHRGTIAACLSYRAYPLPTDAITAGSPRAQEDEDFFLGEAMKGDSEWYGKLMADHTALDWRASIEATFGAGSASRTKVLVVASTRSGCFPAEGPLHVVDLVGGRARGVSVEWGGHWCYWEDAESFNSLCLKFLADEEGDSAVGKWVVGV